MENPRCARSLVVDDEPNILALLCASLRLSGFEVHAADSGARALSTVAQAAPDIVVLDVMLPDCDGFTLARQLRSAHGQLPVLFLTARDGVEDRIHTIRGGGTRCGYPATHSTGVRREFPAPAVDPTWPVDRRTAGVLHGWSAQRLIEPAVATGGFARCNSRSIASGW